MRTSLQLLTKGQWSRGGRLREDGHVGIARTSINGGWTCSRNGSQELQRLRLLPVSPLCQRQRNHLMGVRGREKQSTLTNGICSWRVQSAGVRELPSFAFVCSFLAAPAGLVRDQNEDALINLAKSLRSKACCTLSESNVDQEDAKGFKKRFGESPMAYLGRFDDRQSDSAANTPSPAPLIEALAQVWNANIDVSSLPLRDVWPQSMMSVHYRRCLLTMTQPSSYRFECPNRDRKGTRIGRRRERGKKRRRKKDSTSSLSRKATMAVQATSSH